MIADIKPTGAAPAFAVKRDWAVVRLWNIARIRAEKNHPDLPLLSVFLNRGVIAYGEGGGQVHKPGLDLSIYQVVRRGDFVLNNQQAWRGSVGVSKHDGIISPAYIVLVLGENLNPRFADYLFQSRDMVAQYVTSSKGVGDIQRDIHTPWLKNVKVPVPSPDEQAAIVRFLDWANGRLEQAIRAKRKVIALLNEQKQAIIHRAVTRGLDPDVPLKDSGVEWLGQVPEHWDVLRLKRLGEVKIGLTYSPGDVVGETGTLVLRASNVRNSVIVSVDNVYVSKKVPETLLVTEGDILICVRSGSRNLVGKSALITSELAGVTYGAFMSLLRSKSNDFIFWVLNSNLFVRVMAQFETSTINQLTQSDLKNLFIPVPPMSERAEIVAHLKSATSDIDAAISRLEREVELLREYRTRQSADVVTGKIDVREAAANLPVEIGAGSADAKPEMAELDQEEAGEEEMEAVSEETDA